MIDLQELRIGNYYYANDNEWCMFISGFDETSAISLFGIPITKELLIELCGANNTADDYQNVSIDETMWISFHAGKLFIVTAAWAGKFIYHHHELPHKYLHQLQNLYYGLTGEELAIKFKSE